MRLVDGSLKRPVTVAMATVAVVLFGAVALTRLGVDLLPNISYPSLTVRTDLPDAAPGDVEQYVTRPVEEGVGVVPGLVRMHSISRPGQSEVTLEFVSSTRMDLASLSVREKLDLVVLPREARRPAILRFDPSLDPILRLRLSGGENLQRLRRIADRTVKADLEGVSGVAAVRVAGGEEEEIQVEVDAGRLSAVGISLSDVTRRLGEENVNVAGGSLTEGQAEYLVRATNQFMTPEEIGEVILASRPDGVIRISDVARVARGAKDREVIARVDGDEAVEIAVYKEGDANTVAVARAVQSRLKRIDLPAEMKVVQVSNQARFVEDAIKDVVDSAWIGGLLAILVLFAFLKDLRSTLTVAAAIPISVMATFVIMYRFGLSLNLMSLGGLALGLGTLLDNAIVVLETIHRRREEGDDAFTAASKGTGSVAMAITASTLTCVAVFFPLVFVQGFAGQLIRDQALTISFSNVAALIVALTLVPMLTVLGFRRLRGESIPGAAVGIAGVSPVASPGPAPAGRVRRWGSWVLFLLLVGPRALTGFVSWLGRRIGPVVHRALVPFDRAYARLEASYTPLLRWSLAHRKAVLLSGAASFVASVGIALLLPLELFPSPTQGEFRFTLRMPEGTALAVTDRALDRLARSVQQDPAVRFAYTTAGQTDLSAFAGSVLEPNRGQITVVMKRATDRKGEERIANRLRMALSEAPGLAYEFDRPALLQFKNPVEIEVYGYDLDSLRVAASRVALEVSALRGLEDVESSAREGDPEIQISFDRDRLAAYELDPAWASKLVRNAIQGEEATQFNDLDRKLDVRVRASEAERSHVSSLTQLAVGNPNGPHVPLGAVANVVIDRGPAEIRRIGQRRAAVVTANLQSRDLASASRDIEATLASLDLPDGIRATLAGQNRELAESTGSLQFALLLAIVLVYLVMASQFESLLHPFVVMFSIPLALVGVVAALLVTATPISVMVLIGLIVLAGIVVNNAIVLVDCAKQLRDAGQPTIEALLEAGRLRLRPILMTTLATVLGLVPMALAIGEGAEVRAPLAITLIGGLLGSTLLTLLVIPVVYATFDRSR